MIFNYRFFWCILALLGILFSQQNQNFIHSINLSGNKSISKKEILYIFRQKPSKIIFNPTIFDSRLLKLDALSLKNFYHSKGFLDVLIRESFTTKPPILILFEFFLCLNFSNVSVGE